MSAPGSGRSGRRQPAAPGGMRPMIVLLAIGLLLAGASAADLLAAPARAPAPAPLPQPPATAGTWYCPAVADEGETAVVTVAAVGAEPSQVVVERYAGRRAAPDEPRTIDPGGEAVIELTGEEATAPVSIRWAGGPTAAVWRVDGDRTAAAPCEPAPSERWLATGFNTTLGSRATLHLFNPFTADAVVRLVFATPDGPVRLVSSDNILVGAGGTTSIKLRKFQPEIPDLGVIVEVLAGRVVAQGELDVDPPKGTSGAAGRTMLPAAADTSDAWAFAYAEADDSSESWLSVLNPGEREAAVEVRVSSPSDEGTGLIGEVSVPAGGVTRVELAKASINAEFGVSVRVVNNEPVVVSRLTALSAAGGQALAGSRGASRLSTTWAVVGGGAGERTGLLSVYNPGPTEGTVNFMAEGAPGEWSAIPIGPNGRVKVSLADAAGDLASIPVTVDADVPVVADLRSTSSGERLRLWVNIGVPAEQWIGPTTRPAVRFDPSLSTRAAPVPAATEDAFAPPVDVSSDLPVEASS